MRLSVSSDCEKTRILSPSNTASSIMQKRIAILPPFSSVPGTYSFIMDSACRKRGKVRVAQETKVTAQLFALTFIVLQHDVARTTSRSKELVVNTRGCCDHSKIRVFLFTEGLFLKGVHAVNTKLGSPQRQQQQHQRVKRGEHLSSLPNRKKRRVYPFHWG